MSLTAFNRLRRIEAMKPENIKNAVEEVKEEVKEEVIAVKQEEPELEDIKNEEEVSKPSTTARRRNIRRTN